MNLTEAEHDCLDDMEVQRRLDEVDRMVARARQLADRSLAGSGCASPYKHLLAGCGFGGRQHDLQSIRDYRERARTSVHQRR